MSTFDIGGTRCEPGAFARGTIVGGYTDDGAPIRIPLLVLHGRIPGPVVWLGAAVHGIEVVGAEIIRRVMREAVAAESLAGTILGAPIQNLVAFLDHRYLTPRDGQNINRLFPGDAHGTLSQRVAHALYHQGIARADMVVDIHANSAPAVPFVILRSGNDDVARRSRKMAEAYGLTILESNRQSVDPQLRVLSGLLMDAALTDGKPAITLEYEAWAIDERWVRAGVTGTLNLLKSFDLLPGSPEPIADIQPIAASLTTQVALRATFGGLIHRLVPPGTRVSTGEPVARINDAFGIEREVLRSTVDGYLLCYPRYLNQTVMTGDEAVYIAPFRAT